MPINIPSGLYTGGRATFDTSPMTNAILKQDALEKARKAAEAKAAKAAIEKNYEKMINATNMAGVRNVDIDDVKDPATGAIIEKGLGTRGREIIAKGIETGKLPLEEIMQFRIYVEKSKNYQKEGEKMHQAFIGGKVLPKKGDVDVIAVQGRSMFDKQNFYPYTEADMPANIPDLDRKKYNEFVFKDLKPTKQISQRDLPGGSEIEMIYGLDDNQIKAAADIAAIGVKGNPSAEKTFTEDMNSEVFRNKALPLFRKFYGANEEINTPEKAAAANAILEAQQIKELRKTGIYRKPERRLQKWEYDAMTGGDAAKNELYLNQFIENAYQKGQGYKATIKGTTYSGKAISVPIGVVDKFTIDKGKDWEQKPIQFLMTPDKQQVVPLYQKRDKDGNDMFTASGNPLLDTSNPYSKPMDIQSFKAELAPVVLSKKTTGEEITEEVGAAVPSATPQTKSTKAVKATKRKYD